MIIEAIPNDQASLNCCGGHGKGAVCPGVQSEQQLYVRIGHNCLQQTCA